jgi:trehalose 6-phosphate synthase
MRRGFRFFIALVVGLALLSAAGYLALTHVTRGWFEADLALRTRLATSAANQALVANWGRSREQLSAVLTDMTRDERIMGAAACSDSGDTLAVTEAYPRELSCRSIVHRMRDQSSRTLREYSTVANLPAGAIKLSASPVATEGHSVGAVVLAHDLSYLDRRESTTQRLVLLAFFVLSGCAAVVALLIARFAWRGWTLELRRALAGTPTREFQPLVRDVRTLAEQIASDQVRAGNGGTWSAERLRSTLTQHLRGERIVLLANREPYIHERGPTGQLSVLHPASGLVTALEPVLRACSGVWVAHGSGSADRDVVDEHDRVRVPPGENSYTVRRVWLSRDEERGYYYGFSNEGLWPLCHLAHARPLFRAVDFEHYERVNRKFAEAVCEEVDSDDPIILVQDYHFALAPKMIRKRLPRATIITFWHIPWPNSERFGICPWREEILDGLTGSSIIGFHTQQHCNNFLEAVDAYMESRIDRESNAVFQGARRTLVRPYPISIEWPVHYTDDLPSASECHRAIRGQLGLREDCLLGVGVDRLDYTKGIEERFQAVDQLLERFPDYRGRFVFIQVAAPSRTEIDRYRELSERVVALAQQINERWASDGYQPIVLLRSHHTPAAVFRFYRAADVCYVSSLHDGMNLVAKEFVAARDDERGVLLLSQFTGAARELTEALIVNPYDLKEASDALAYALRMPSDEQRDRMRAMRRHLADYNVYRWAGKMLYDAAELRRRERLRGRIGSVHARAQ